MPTPQEVETKIREIVCKKLAVSPDKVTLQTSFINDLGADSLDVVELMMEIEDAFKLSITDEDAEKIRTVGDAVKYISENAGK